MKRKIPYRFLFLFLFMIAAFTSRSIAQSLKEQLKMKTEKQLRGIIDSSPALTGIMAIDLTSGESFGINENLVFPTASAIKVTILMEVFKQAAEKKFALTDMRNIEPQNTVGGSGILKNFADPVALSVRNLCVLMMSLSDNTATNAIIDLVTINSVNATLKSLGFKDTKLQRKMLDVVSSAQGIENVASPAEAAKIMQVLFKGAFISKAMCADILAVMMKKEREDSRIAKGLPANVPIVFKPGLLSGVSTEWAIVNLKERPYAVAIMENYKVDGTAKDIIEQLSAVLYQYFWRMGNSTKYGVYADPALIK